MAQTKAKPQIKITRRELELLQLLSDSSLTVAAIAELMVVEAESVRVMATRLYRKLGVHSRFAAVGAWRRLNRNITH